MNGVTAPPAAPPAPPTAGQAGNAYNLFILVLTVASLLIMVLLWLPFSPATLALLRAYGNAICVDFLVDVGLRLRRAPSKRGYLFRGGAGSTCSARSRSSPDSRRPGSSAWRG